MMMIFDDFDLIDWSVGGEITFLLFRLPLHLLFGKSYNYPCWKKKSCPKENNDFRPVALTSIVMKSLEGLIVGKLSEKVECLLEPTIELEVPMMH